MHEVDRWQQQAERIATSLKRHAPTYAATPEIQFPYATLMRHRGRHELADAVYRTFAMSPGESVWMKAAQGEIWLVGPQAVSPKPVLQCLRCSTPPVLDGQLDDACWQSASAIRLTPAPETRTDDETFVGADPDCPGGGNGDGRGSDRHDQLRQQVPVPGSPLPARRRPARRSPRSGRTQPRRKPDRSGSPEPAD